MKKTLVIIAILTLSAVSYAQAPKHHDKQPRNVSELVSDLSASQKRKVDAIGRESKERVSALRAQQQAVRDSIGLYMDRDGDQSKNLYPLFDREAKLQVAVNREMYSTKLRIDQVLTPKQREELRQSSRQRRGNK